MSENNTNTSNRSRGRDGRRRGPNRGGNRGNYRNQGPRPKAPQQTGFEKFLSIITFGLLGKPQAKPHQNRDSKPSQPPVKKELGPIARADRAEREEKKKEARETRPPKSAPVSAEVTNERLYIGNLSYDATESDLFELFNGSGSVKNAEVVVNSRTQRSKGFAFVTMTSIDGAKKAVADLNGKEFMGRPLVVGGAKPLAPREERSAPQSKAPAQEEASAPEVQEEISEAPAPEAPAAEAPADEAPQASAPEVSAEPSHNNAPVA